MTLELILRVTVLLTVAVGALFMMRRASAAMRHLVGSLALLALLLIPLAASTLPRWELPILQPESRPTVTPQKKFSVDPALVAKKKKAADYQPVQKEWTPRPVLEAKSVAATPASFDIEKWIGVAAALWIVGFLLVVSRLAVGWYRMNQIAVGAVPVTDDEKLLVLLHRCCQRMQIHRPPRLMLSSELQVPVLWGVWTPVLILPNHARNWTTGRLRVALLHELAHMRRRDGLFLLLGRVSAALWWFQPAVWWVESRARQDCERACDDLVVRCGERPSEYARHLLEIAGELPAANSAPAEALSMMGTGNFERRLRSILTRDTRRGIRPLMTLAIVAIFAVTITTLAVAKPVKRDVKVHVQVSEQPGESLYDRAFDFHNNEEWADAADLFEQAAAEGFRPSTSLYNAACGYARMGDASTAIDLIERAMEHGFDSHKYLLEDSDLDPIRGDAGFQELLERVKVGAHNDRFVVASKSYEKLQAEGSEDADDWYSVGTDLLSMREFDRAIDALNEANRLDGGSANALYNLACAYSLDGSTRQALDHLEQAVLQGFDSEERFANDSDLDNIRDESAFGEIKELHDSLSLDQYRKGNWGNSEYSERRWAPAIKDMQVLVQASPNTGRAWSNLGWAFHHSKRHADARDAFLRQLDLGYRSTHAIYNVGCTYAMEGQSDSAIEWIQRAVDTDDVSVHQLLNDEDLESLRDDSRWEALLQQAAAGQPYEVHRGLIQEIKHKIQEVI